MPSMTSGLPRRCLSRQGCLYLRATLTSQPPGQQVKTLHLFMHAAEMQPWAPLYVLKTDDDTFLRMDRLLSELYMPPHTGAPSNASATTRECLYWGKSNRLDRSLTQLPVTNKWYIPPQLVCTRAEFRRGFLWL
jgi:hypothetical protein